MENDITHSLDEPLKRNIGQVTIDLNKMYRIDPENMVIDISNSTYSNLSYIQVTQRDVFIDFLQMPGTKKDDKIHVSGARIYMSYSGAQRLSEVLKLILDDTYKRGKMEEYKPAEEESPEKEPIKEIAAESRP